MLFSGYKKAHKAGHFGTLCVVDVSLEQSQWGGKNCGTVTTASLYGWSVLGFPGASVCVGVCFSEVVVLLEGLF